jgi:lysophospholipase L1-like esterase
VVYGDKIASEYFPGTDFRFAYYDHPERYYRMAGFSPRYVEHRINPDGYRGGAVPQTKTAGSFRVVFLGDSFTFGEGVPEGYDFPAKVEKILNQANSFAGKHCEVINGGVSGHNTSDEVLDLERRWLAYEPDMAIIVFYLNDAYDEGQFARLITGGAEGVSTSQSEPDEPVSYLFSFTKNRWQRYLMSRQVADIYKSQFSDNPMIDGQDWAGARLALAHAKKMTSARGIKLGLVIFPELFELTDAYPFRKIHEEVVNTAVTLGIPTLDLLETFRGRPPEKLWVHVTDHHPNEIAHGLAADTIVRFVTALDRDGH